MIVMGIVDWFRKPPRKQETTPSPSVDKVTTLQHGKPRPRIERDGAIPKRWAGQREEHYERWLGSGNWACPELYPFVPQITVYVYPPSAELNREFYTIITSGMSDLPMNLPADIDKSWGRAELLMYAKDDPNQAGAWAVDLLRHLAAFPFEHDTWFGCGHTIPNGGPPEPFVPGSQLDTSLLLYPVWEPDDFYEGFQIEGEPIHLLWVQPITSAELQFKLERGLDAMLDLMDERQLPRVVDPFRPSMV